MDRKENIYTRTFKIVKIEDPFNIYQNYKAEVLIDIDWRKNGNDKFQTEQLNKQIKANVLIQRQLENICKKYSKTEQFEMVIITNYEANLGHIFESKALPFLKDTCISYLKNIRNEHDVISRDSDVFSAVAKYPSNDVNIEIYCILAYDENGQYIGHVYTWVSPSNSSFTFMIGIRSSGLLSFMRLKGNGIKNVSKYLLDGVINFAIKKGSDKLVIPKPIGKMIEIAKKNGFQKYENITNTLVGKGGKLTEGMINSERCDWCYLKKLLPDVEKYYYKKFSDDREEQILRHILNNDPDITVPIIKITDEGFYSEFYDQINVETPEIILQKIKLVVRLHKIGVYHNDLRDDNFLIKNGVVKVIDFDSGYLTIDEEWLEALYNAIYKYDEEIITSKAEALNYELESFIESFN